MLLGTTYGGDGITTFALSDLSGRAAFAAGGPSPHQRGETGGLIGVTGSGLPGGLGLTYVFMTEGVYPSPPRARSNRWCVAAWLTRSHKPSVSGGPSLASEDASGAAAVTKCA